MALAEMLKKYRAQAGLATEDVAKALSLPKGIIAYIENPKEMEPFLIDIICKALKVKPEVFRGEAPVQPPKPKEPTPEEVRQRFVQAAKYQKIREFILDPAYCKSQDKVMELIKRQEFSLAERNIVLYLGTVALYHFCDYNYSCFAFDQYLFRLHASLLEKFERDLEKENLAPEQKEDLLINARANVFACDKIENITILVLDDFSRELEEKLQKKRIDFENELELPFFWTFDDALMQIEIKDKYNNLKHRIKLLDVKAK